MEMRVHGLVVAYALGIVALHDVDELVGQGHAMLLDHLIVLDDVDHGVGGDESDAVERRLGIGDIGNLDDALLAHQGAVEVEANGDTAREALDVEQVDNLEQSVAGNVVDDRAVAQGSHCKFFFIFCHDRCVGVDVGSVYITCVVERGRRTGRPRQSMPSERHMMAWRA